MRIIEAYFRKVWFEFSLVAHIRSSDLSRYAPNNLGKYNTKVQIIFQIDNERAAHYNFDAVESNYHKLQGNRIFMPPDRWAHSRCFVLRLTDRPSVHPPHFFPEHISKSIEGNLMKLDDRRL